MLRAAIIASLAWSSFLTATGMALAQATPPNPAASAPAPDSSAAEFSRIYGTNKDAAGTAAARPSTNPSVAVDSQPNDPSTSEFSRIYGMGNNTSGARVQAAEKPALAAELRTALQAQNARTKVPAGDDTAAQALFLKNNRLLQHLSTSKGGPDMFHLLLWNEFALDATSLDHTTKGERVGNVPVIEPSYAEQLGPARSSRALTIVHLAIFEAVNTIVHRFESYKPSGATSDIYSSILADLHLSAAEIDPSRASVPEAIARAAYQTLVYLYPQKRPIFEAELTQTAVLIERGNANSPKAMLGRMIGDAAAAHVIAARQNDGSEAPGVNSAGCPGGIVHRTCLEPRFSQFTEDKGRPLDWQPDPVSKVLSQLGSTWPAVMPFVTLSHQFLGKTASGADVLLLGGTERPRPSEGDTDFQQSLGSGPYGGRRPDPRVQASRAEIWNKYGVRQFGGFRVPGSSLGAEITGFPAEEGKRWSTPTKRDRDLTDRAVYWAYDGTALLCAPPRLYNMIATSVALNERKVTRVSDMARYLALVNLALGDAGIAAWDAKFKFAVGRPVSYIRYAKPDAVHDGLADKLWTPFGQGPTNGGEPDVTPAFPAYPSGHAVFGGALFEIMRKYFNKPAKDDPTTRFTFVSDEYNGLNQGPDGQPRPLKPVTFRSFGAAEWENAESRIWLGIHWQRDSDDGVALGNEIADHVFANVLKPIVATR